jgi:DNA end-binding protein Ku
MKATGMVGISRLVLYRRERAVMLEPRDAGIVLWTLRYGDEVRAAGDYFATIKAERVDSGLLSLVSKLIDERSKPWDARMVGDPVQERLKDIIAAKRKGKAKRPAARSQAEPEPPSNVIDILEALRRSLAADGKRGRGK